MPWSVCDAYLVRRRTPEVPRRVVGACIATLIAETGAALRRRSSEEVAKVATLLSSGQFCAPCLMVLAELDARAIYQALDRLREAVDVKLIAARCDRCRRTTNVNTLQSDRTE